MTRTVYPYVHRDLSSLAKHLRGAVADRYGTTIKQTEMLAMLAKAAGYRNLQAYQSSNVFSDSDSRLVSLQLVPTTGSELYERGADGSVVDRRQVPTHRLIYRFNVEIDCGTVKAEIVIRATARGEFASNLDIDEAKLVDRAMKAIAQRLNHNVTDLVRTLEVDIDGNHLGAVSHRTGWKNGHLLRLGTDRFRQVEAAVRDILATTNECERCLEFLRSVASDPTRARAERVQVNAALDYLWDVVECSGQPFMYSWNCEKLTGIDRIMRKWVHGTSVGDADRRYAFDNLFVFDAPSAWTKRPRRLNLDATAA